jgi:predicted lipoprotein with Yx(FWY)xxD motif
MLLSQRTHHHYAVRNNACAFALSRAASTRRGANSRITNEVNTKKENKENFLVQSFNMSLYMR